MSAGVLSKFLMISTHRFRYKLILVENSVSNQTVRNPCINFVRNYAITSIIWCHFITTKKRARYLRGSFYIPKRVSQVTLSKPFRNILSVCGNYWGQFSDRFRPSLKFYALTQFPSTRLKHNRGLRKEGTFD